MILFISRSPHILFYGFILLLHLSPHVNSLLFNFSTFQPNTQNIFYQGDAFVSSGVIQLTKNQRQGSIINSVGRASYDAPLHLWDAKTRKLTDFTTHFSFIIDALNLSMHGDGLSFFLAPFNAEIPTNSFGGFLGLFNGSSNVSSAKDHIVAVEFDSLKNTWDPNDDHVGINVNSIVSVASVQWTSSIKDGKTANAWVSYNSSTQNMSVFLTYADNPVLGGNSSLSYIVDLREVLPEWVRIGFSAATGEWIELHNILSWSFSSTLEDSGGNKNIWLVVGLAVGIGALAFCAALFWFIRYRKRASRRKTNMSADACMSYDFEKGTGPKRFTFGELSRATNNFSEEGKLGEGGFGGVYKGLLNDTSLAVKRVSSGSKQGKKEFVSEVMIISRLRHRNLVQLIGWCHEQSEFLLVYEFMPNGSLDSHLFYGKSKLTWLVRYKIALGLASALLYLHEEWEQCVVHRDVKSSNVMLDSNYNAKLGDFGLARLVDHDLGSQTTVLAGTMGYLAPECVTMGKASKESDVYSFGVVALEITCGRKPVEPKAADPSKVRLVEWVWGLYGKGQLLQAADKGLALEFDECQLECLMVVGLWCCHPDFNFRPTMKQVINVLNFEAPLPSLPSKLPVPTYYAPPISMCRFSYISSGGNSGGTTRTQCSCSSCSSSTGIGSSKALLESRHGHA